METVTKKTVAKTGGWSLLAGVLGIMVVMIQGVGPCGPATTLGAFLLLAGVLSAVVGFLAMVVGFISYRVAQTREARATERTM